MNTLRQIRINLLRYSAPSAIWPIPMMQGSWYPDGQPSTSKIFLGCSSVGIRMERPRLSSVVARKTFSMTHQISTKSISFLGPTSIMICASRLYSGRRTHPASAHTFLLGESDLNHLLHWIFRRSVLTGQRVNVVGDFSLCHLRRDRNKIPLAFVVKRGSRDSGPNNPLNLFRCYRCTSKLKCCASLLNILFKFHRCDHSFPLRSKAPKWMKHRCLSYSKLKFVKIGLRKQVYYRARGGE